MKAARRRVDLGEHVVLTPAEACAELRVRRDAGMAFLEEHHLICHVRGQPRVIWSDVLRAIRRSGLPGEELPPPTPQRPASRPKERRRPSTGGRLPRVSLD